MRQRVLPTDCDEQRDAAKRTAGTILRKARTYAKASGIKISTATASGRPARQILSYAEENDIDRIVMRTHGRSGLDRLLFGSLSDLVRKQSSVPVTIVPEPTTSEPAEAPLKQTQEQDQREPLVSVTENPPLSPRFWWCPFCTVSLYTHLEFCPGCLGVTIPAGQ